MRCIMMTRYTMMVCEYDEEALRWVKGLQDTLRSARVEREVRLNLRLHGKGEAPTDRISDRSSVQRDEGGLVPAE